MSISINSSYVPCPSKHCAVHLEQTEGQCRESHRCGEDPCPLEGMFGQNNFERALAHLLPGFQSGWRTERR